MSTCCKALIVLAVMATALAVLWVRATIDARGKEAIVDRYHELCRGVAIGIDSAALAADHNDSGAVRNVLAMQHVLDGCAIAGRIDLDPLSGCYVRDDMRCAAAQLRALATQLPGR